MQHDEQASIMMIEGALNLLFARLMLRFMAFPQLMAWLARPLTQATPSQQACGDAVVAVQQVLQRLWSLGWLRDTCFHRAIAASLMLRRRGIPTCFHYGAATLPSRRLTGHVWLTAGDLPVVGSEQMPSYQHLHSWGNEPFDLAGNRAATAAKCVLVNRIQCSQGEIHGPK